MTYQDFRNVIGEKQKFLLVIGHYFPDIWTFSLKFSFHLHSVPLVLSLKISDGNRGAKSSNFYDQNWNSAEVK